MNNKFKKETSHNLVFSGNWKNTTFWNFFTSFTLPEDATPTTVTGLIIWEGKVVLVKNNRGWELPGGHIEKEESIQEALIRELYEEAGLQNIKFIEMFGYNQIINPDSGSINKVTGEFYPKHAYNPHFIIETDDKPIGCQDGSCDDIGFFEIDSEEIETSHVKDIIRLGYSHYSIKKA